jgi:hypothetical protein
MLMKIIVAGVLICYFTLAALSIVALIGEENDR